MAMLADVVDAVIGGDTHRDTHTLEMTSPTGATISVCTIANTAAGFAEALGWIADHAPGERLIVGLEGTRSYGIGLARAAAAAGLKRPRFVCERGRSISGYAAEDPMSRRGMHADSFGVGDPIRIPIGPVVERERLLPVD